MTANRVVALLTPLVFAPLAGVCAAWLAEHFPGVNIDEGQLREIFIAGALIALAPAAQWLHGWQKHEARLAEAEVAAQLAGAAAPPVAASEMEPDAAPSLIAGFGGDEIVDDADEFDGEAAANGQPLGAGA